MAAINWTLEAERWLKDIHDYIAMDNPNAAVGTFGPRIGLGSKDRND